METCAVTYQCQIESFDSWLQDSQHLWPEHWQELTMDKDLGTPWPAEEQFREVEKLGRLLIVTVREDWKMVGYWIGALLPHLHYRDCGLMCYTDMYFLSPSARRGNVGIRMLALAEEEAKKRGATKFYISCKVHQDHSALFDRMGFNKTDFMFTKRLDK